MYFEYLKECFGFEVIEEEYGFIIYDIKSPYCYIIDLYIKPEFRRKGLASEFGERVETKAREKNCKYKCIYFCIKNVQ